MKKVLLAVVITTALVLPHIRTTEIKAKAKQGHEYSLTTVVVSVDYTTDTVKTMDATGNIWKFTGVEDWTPDDVCSMVMYDNGTADIHDDVIINAKYSSFTIEK